MLYIFTTSALNFVPCAKLLAESVKQHLPQARFVLTLADEKPDDFRLEDEGFDEVLYLGDFADDLDNPKGWAFGHTIMELATALKPFVAAKLLARKNCEAVLFFDPDCYLYDRLDQVHKVIQSHSIVLTPHASLLHENADWVFFERNPLKVGAFNLGFFGLRNNETGRAIASWWRFRLKNNCVIDPEQGLFTDQKWIDLLPSYTDDIKVLREPVYNLARWNTFQRTVTKEGDRYLVDGQPLQFIHFSGFYKVGPYVRGLYDRSSEPHVKNIELLRELSLWYSSELERVRTREIYRAPWPLGRYSNGEDIPDADRRRYRNSDELRDRYPDPFAADSFNSFWLHCRKQERLEAEMTFAEQPGLAELVPRSVRSHNMILRRHNETLNAQLLATTNALRAAEERLRSFGELANSVKTKVSSLAQTTPDDAMADTFASFLGDDGFDPDWYLETNPDVADEPTEPLSHFLRFGLLEGRAPSPSLTVDGLVYRYMRGVIGHASETRFADDANETLNAQLVATTNALRAAEERLRSFGELANFVKTKVSSLAQTTPDEAMADTFASFLGDDGFDPDWYLETNPDVADVSIQPLSHFLQFGLLEGRAPLPSLSADGLIYQYMRGVMGRALAAGFADDETASDSIRLRSAEQ